MTYRTKIIALSAAVVLLSVQAVAFTDIRSVIAQNQDRMPLLAEIVNGEDDPVPVSLQGTGDVSGDVNASQTGEWNVEAEQSGEWTVNIDPDANTVRMDGLTDANKEVFQGEIDLTWGDSATASRSFTVPDGKRLVIEHISAHAITDDQMDMVFVRTPPHTTFGSFWDTDTIISARLLMSKGDDSDYVGSQETTIYVDGGQIVELFAVRDSSSESGQNQVFVTLTGYLVDLP